MPVTETKAQRVERLKRELNPWEAYAEIQRFAREGWDAIPPPWLGTYFRWWGIYTQGDGIGAIGGKGGEGKATRHFMVRIRIPNGQLQAHQLRTIAGLAERYARGIADITVRQNIQLHWVTLESLPDVFQTLWRTGITTMGACGDVTRNVTGCPLAGLDADEIVDASPLVHGSERRRVHGAQAPGDGGDRLRRAGRRRPLDRPPPRHAARCVRALARGAAGPPGGLGDLPGLGRAEAESREGAAQVPLPPARLDRGEIPRGGRGSPRIRPRAQGARRPAGGCLP